jgi:hypothetical protein
MTGDASDRASEGLQQLGITLVEHVGRRLPRPNTQLPGVVPGFLFMAPSVTGWAWTAFPELGADRPYHQPGYDSRP